MLILAQSAGAREYTDCISTEGLNSPKECPDDTKQFGSEVPAMLVLWEIWSTPLSSLPVLSDLEW